MIKTLSVAAIIAVTATASFAGSYGTAEVRTQPQQEAILPVAGSGIGVPVVIGGVLAAAAVAALISKDSDSDTDTPELED